MEFGERASDTGSSGVEAGGRTVGFCALYRVIVPRQNIVVRLNGPDPDAPEDGYLPAARPYGTLRMAWAIWREVPDVAPRSALSLALRVRSEGRAEILVAARFLAEHVQGVSSPAIASRRTWSAKGRAHEQACRYHVVR